jgi:amino acid adenylation domain-containing protein
MTSVPAANLAWPVYEQGRRLPNRTAVLADGQALTYAQLVERAARLAGVLSGHGIGAGRRIGILGSRSLVAVEAVLAAAWVGATYVPLGLRWPQTRLASVLARLRLDALIVDRDGLQHPLPEAAVSPIALTIVADDRARAALPDAIRARALSLESLPSARPLATPADVDPQSLAYIIFTSGTTGAPKGVMVTVRAVAAYLRALGARKAMTPADKATQFTELSFDPSIGEIYLPWYAGAALYVVPPVTAVSPVKFVRDHGLTVWGSAPAAIAWLRNARALQPGALATLRYSSFGGEPLTLDAVRAWQAAAPNSVVDNLYGPTEATVDCCGQRVEPGALPAVTPGRGVLAIGIPHPGSELAIVDERHRPLPRDAVGEIAIAGAQLSLGYLDDPALSAQRFREIDGKRWYLTGDLGMQDAAGCFHHLGRMDNQIKIHGHRVELEEIEAHAREAAGTDQVAAVAWPVQDGVAQGIVCFVARTGLAAAAIRALLRQRLPGYMLPTAIECVAALPVGGSGKIDRQALIARLAERREHQA